MTFTGLKFHPVNLQGFQAMNGKPYVPPPPYGHTCLPATRVQRNLQLTIHDSSPMQIGHHERRFAPYNHAFSRGELLVSGRVIQVKSL